MPRLTIEVKGLAELQRKLDPKSLYWQPVKDALDELGRSAAQQATREASGFRKTGALASGITHRVNAVPVPLWVVVTTRKTGRRYPWILEFEAKFGHQNWLLNAVRRAQGQAGAALSKAVGKIQSKWGG